MSIRLKMRVLPSKPREGTATVFVKPRDIPQEKRFEPFIIGTGNMDHLCGLCEHMLVKSINPGQVQGFIYECPNCGVFNQVE